jgi:hypothetical protein
MQRELAAAGHTISINTLTVLLREEGFSRLPRRLDDERPHTVKPETAEVADVRRLDRTSFVKLMVIDCNDLSYRNLAVSSTGYSYKDAETWSN